MSVINSPTYKRGYELFKRIGLPDISFGKFPFNMLSYVLVFMLGVMVGVWLG